MVMRIENCLKTMLYFRAVDKRLYGDAHWNLFNNDDMH